MNMPTDKMSFSDPNYTPILPSISEKANETEEENETEHDIHNKHPIEEPIHPIYNSQPTPVGTVHIPPTLDEPRKPDEKQKFGLTYTIRIKTADSDTENHRVHATFEYVIDDGQDFRHWKVIRMPQRDIISKKKT